MSLEPVLLSSSEQASLSQAAELPEHAAESLSVDKGQLCWRGKPLRSAWRSAGVYAFLYALDHPLLKQVRSAWLRTDPGVPLDAPWLHAMPKLRTLRLSLADTQVPALPVGLESLQVDLGRGPIRHERLRTLHLNGWTQRVDGVGLELPALTELRIERLSALVSLDGLRAPTLASVDLEHCPALAQLSALSECPLLRSLRAARCGPVDLGALRSPPLERVVLTGTLGAQVPASLRPITSPKAARS
ncbi:MAG: hypothetical protein VX899_13760 [Myxococcota bacterium]|nr:hypothetical protein [Myxococcota bacterium]